MAFELTNAQRKYFGLEPLESHWDRVALKDGYPTDGFLFYEGDIIKRHIVSVDFRYSESNYNELTRNRTVLLPKTSKGKEKKLSSSTLGQRNPIGVYLEVNNHGVITIGNHTTQTTFYSSRWDKPELAVERRIEETVAEFISQSPIDHLSQIEKFKRGKRKRVRFRAGDYFSFKLSRELFGFGRVLLDINKLRKSGLLTEKHGLNLLMGPPVLIQLFAFSSPNPRIDIAELERAPKLPSDVMMDNVILYGEYELIGHKELTDEEFEFPISYGRSIDRRPIVFLQWGLIHRELPLAVFDKYLVEDNPNVPENHPSRKISNPFGYYSIGFRPRFDSGDIFRTIDGGGIYNFDLSKHFISLFDLRNPKNRAIKREILEAFGLDPDGSYERNRRATGTPATTEIIKALRD
ncbi:MAG: immunity 26/phosphotriesterase HocA family protein [Chloracidobacterium sp.]|nr:immunity 26/phosphotriesterase HocA family protein [Chloracidobacterium sp.]